MSPITGFTIISTHFQSADASRRHTQKIRSAGVSRKRFGADRRTTASCCRNAKFSSRNWAELLNSEATTPAAPNEASVADKMKAWKSINLNHCRYIRIFWRDSPAGGRNVQMGFALRTDEERAAVGEHREDERYHHLSSSSLTQTPIPLQTADSLSGPTFDDRPTVRQDLVPASDEVLAAQPRDCSICHDVSIRTEAARRRRLSASGQEEPTADPDC